MTGEIFDSCRIMVSAIIPTYNRCDVIQRAINTVCNQSYKNLEIIVVDDASADNTEAVVKSMSDPRIRYIRHETNLGGATTRNTGIDAAKGEYIAFLDSDDLWKPQKISLQLASIHEHPDSAKVVSYTQVENYNGRHVSIMPTRGKQDTESVEEYLFVNGGEMHTSTLMLSRSLAVSTRFRPGLKKHQDLDFCLRLAASGAKFTFVEKPLTVWVNEQRSDRISKIADYRISLNWIREYESSISPKATKGFLIKEVVPKLLEQDIDRGYTAKIILEAGWYGAVSLQKFAILMGKVAIPGKIRKKLKYLVTKPFRDKL